MIDYEITFKETGLSKEYFIKYPNSGKKVYRICNECKQGKWVRYQNHHNLCVSCSKKGKRCGMYGVHRYGEDAPHYGHKHSDETKKKMGESGKNKHRNFGENNPNWKGGIAYRRDHVLTESACIKLNQRFNNSEFHHITKSIGVFIPKELHRHFYHSLKNGHGIGSMNMLALQFINGGL